jgi:hypothetical protein
MGEAPLFKPLAFLFLLAAPPAQAGVCDRYSPCDTGGNIFARATEVLALNLLNRNHEIHGYCSSACTMYLGVDDSCVDPEAVLGFHSARFRGLGRNDLLNRVVADHYPREIRRWFWEGPAHTTSTTRVTGAFLNWHFGIELCDD